MDTNQVLFIVAAAPLVLLALRWRSLRSHPLQACAVCKGNGKHVHRTWRGQLVVGRCPACKGSKALRDRKLLHW